MISEVLSAPLPICKKTAFDPVFQMYKSWRTCEQHNFCKKRQWNSNVNPISVLRAPTADCVPPPLRDSQKCFWTKNVWIVNIMKNTRTLPVIRKISIAHWKSWRWASYCCYCLLITFLNGNDLSCWKETFRTYFLLFDVGDKKDFCMFAVWKLKNS